MWSKATLFVKVFNAYVFSGTYITNPSPTAQDTAAAVTTVLNEYTATMATSSKLDTTTMSTTVINEDTTIIATTSSNQDTTTVINEDKTTVTTNLIDIVTASKSNTVSCSGVIDGGYIKDPVDCRVFYRCVYNSPVKFAPCAEGQRFDTTYNVCVLGSC